LCVSQKGEFKNKKKWKKAFFGKCMLKTCYKKAEGENTFSLSFPPFNLFLSHFGPFFCMRSSKTPYKKPENLKNRKSNAGR
jgi:hypothetical protein